MTETDQETTNSEGKEPEDIAEEAAGEEASLVVALSRGAGVVVRSFSDGLQNVADAFRFRKPPPRRLPEEPVPELIQKLGELIEAHREGGYASLEETPDFWRLVAKLRNARRKQIAERSARAGRKRKARRVEDAVIESESGGKESASDAAPADDAAAKKKKKKKAEESAPASAGGGAAPEAAAKEGAASTEGEGGKPGA